MGEYRERLEAAMRRARVDRRALAQHLDVSLQAVQKVLDGKSNGFNAVNHARAAMFLGVDPDWLALGVGEMLVPERRLSGQAMVVAIAVDAITDERLKAEAAALLERLLARNAERLRDIWPIGKPIDTPAPQTETLSGPLPSAPSARRTARKAPPDLGGR